MMLPYGIDYVITVDRYAEHLREAEKRQLTRMTREGQRRNGRLSPVLIWLGRRLVAWGRYLEQRGVVQPTSKVGSRC
jgi:hypothetical protein